MRAIPAHSAALQKMRQEMAVLFSSSSSLRGHGVLVLEDNLPYALRTQAMLDEIGYGDDDVHFARDLTQAQAALHRNDFAAVLCDLDLPDSQGLDTVRAVLDRAGNAAVIVLSGVGNQDLALRAVSEGAQDFVVKGCFDASVLQRVLAYSLERRRILSQVQAMLKQHRRDLEAAAEVQRSMLPQDQPALPGFACGWRHLPSELISGDICNAVPLDDRFSVAYVLDVMGHGVSAALLACQVSRLLLPGPGSLLSSDAGPTSPDQVLTELNKRFQLCDTAGRFFTMCYLLLDAREQTVTVSSAGHPPVVLCRADGTVTELKPRGMAVGITSGSRYQVATIPMAAGDRMFLCSDGFEEARDEAGTMFGDERIRLLLSRSAMDLQAVLGGLVDASLAWSASQEDDDRTILAVECR